MQLQKFLSSATKHVENFNSSDLFSCVQYLTLCKSHMLADWRRRRAEPGHKFAFLWNSLLSLVNSQALAHPNVKPTCAIKGGIIHNIRGFLNLRKSLPSQLLMVHTGLIGISDKLISSAVQSRTKVEITCSQLPRACQTWPQLT